MEVTVGSGITVSFPGGTDWPDSLHECPLPSEALPVDEDVVVIVKVQQVQASVTLKGMVRERERASLLCPVLCAGGESEGWWLSDVEHTFSTSLTATASTVLQDQLSSCRDLLDLEPDNKCKSVRWGLGKINVSTHICV